MFKKWGVILVSLALVLSSFAFVTAPAFAMGTTNAVAKPKSGKFVDSGLKGLIKTQETTSGNLLKGKTYVIFRVNKSQLAAFKRGEMGIFSYNNRTHTYRKLAGFEVSAGKGHRVAALASRFGTYFFGKMVK